MDMRDHALELAAKGFRVIPLHWPILDTIDGVPLCSCGSQKCTSIGKHPLTAHGVKDAQSGQLVVTSWWTQYPQANIGIATGFDFDVIDIDGPDGANALAGLTERFGYPQYTASVQTGRDGGGHLYTAGGGMQSWTGGSGGHPPHLDCKGRGGYVVAPPSLHASGRRYTWLLEPGTAGVSGVVPWADWHELVRESAAATARTGGMTGSGELVIRQPSAGGHGFAEAVRARVLAEVLAVPEGGRWNAFSETAIWVCAGLVTGGEISVEEAITFCEELGREIGLSDREVGRVRLTEMRRAIGNRNHPIQSTAGQVPATVAGVTDVTAEALSGDPGQFERMELERQTYAARIRLRANEAARRQIAQEDAGARVYAPRLTLAELMALPPEDVRYRVEGLWPAGGRAMLSAQFKAGKTTMVGNIVRCLADSSSFLSRYQAAAPEGSIALFDTEMSVGMLQAWLSAQGIENTEKVSVFAMRGFLNGFDLTDDLVRAHWVRQLREADADVLILDCLGPIMAACGLDESLTKDAGTFINAFERLLSEAGIRESMIVHHMGHAGERSRGASRLRDWPDVEWHLIRQGQENESAPAPDVPRYFRAYGRDVSAPEQLLHYEPNMRWLSVNGGGNRREVRSNRLTGQIIDIVRAKPGITVRGIQNLITGRQVGVRDAIKQTVIDGHLKVIDGPRNGQMHYISE